MSHPLPPQLEGAISIRPFQGADAAGRWLIHSGSSYFLAPADVAAHLRLLNEMPGSSYAELYQRHIQETPSADAFVDFVSWYEARRTGITQLHAARPSSHALRFRFVLLTPALCARLTRPLGALFRTRYIVVCGILVVALWSCLPDATRTVEGASATAGWAGLGLAMIGVALHELGHIAACVHLQVAQGGIGAGIYWIWPALYADVRDSWSLPPTSRAMISVAGVYFQSIYLIALQLCYLASGSPACGYALSATVVLMLTTLNPLFKFDGYWILSDLTNTVNLHTRIQRSLYWMANRGRAGRANAWPSGRDIFLALGFIVYGMIYLAWLVPMLLTGMVRSASQLGEAWRELATDPIGTDIPGATLRILGNTIFFLFIGLVLFTLCQRSIRQARALTAPSADA